MSRRWLAPAALAAVLLAAGGCSGGDDPAPVPPASPSLPSAAASPDGEPVADTREFVTAVQVGLPAIAANRSDEEISAIGAQICAGLGGGDPADDLVATTRSLNTADAEATDHATARELIKLAIDVACPDQAGRVDEF